MTIAKLRIINSDLSGREFILPPHPVVIGRGATCDVVIPDQSVSRQHVRAELKGLHCFLTDLGSHNGIVMGDKSFREARIAAGQRFELGDVAIEFRLEEQPQTAPAPPAVPDTLPVPEGYMLAQPGALPAGRPVLVDDVFKAPAGEPGPGDEEKAAFAGARSAIGYFVVLALIIGAGILAWNLVGRKPEEPNKKPVLVKCGEDLVIDLGLKTRQAGGRLVPYIDDDEAYSDRVYLDPEGEEIARLELDPTGFMAIVTGVNPGTTDIQITGPGGRKAIVQVFVRGEVPRPLDERRLTPAEVVARARLLVNGAKFALSTGYLYQAMKKFEQAVNLLQRAPGEEIQLRVEANRLYAKTRDEIEKRYEQIKNQAIARIRDRDNAGAARDWDELRQLIPDPDDIRNQKLKVIFDRTVRKIPLKGD